VFPTSQVSAQEAYDSLAEVYDSSFTSKTARAEDDIIYSQLRSYFTRSSILDLGCGTGALLDNLDVDSKDYVGVDISENMIEKARLKHPNCTFHVGDMANLPFNDEQFNNVVCLYGGISYADPKVYSEIMRVLKPQGKYFLMLLNPHYEKRKSYILKDYGFHVSFDSLQDVKDYLPNHYVAVGFNFQGDSFNFLPKRVIRWILRAEMTLLGKLFKTKAFYCLVYGVKVG